jgi:outer membrane protein assembly factor BamA
LLHRFNLTHFGLAVVLSLLASVVTAHAAQQPLHDAALSFEGETVTSVEVAGRPDLNSQEFTAAVAQRNGELLSSANVQATVSALKAAGQSSGRFRDVQVEIRPEQDGVRVLFVLQPAFYFGVYQFEGVGAFSYARLLQASNYASQEPYSSVDVERAEASLQLFLRRNGYFESEVRSEVKADDLHRLANVAFYVKLNRKADFGDVKIEGASPEEAEHLRLAVQSVWARIHLSAIREGKGYSYKTLQNAPRYLENDLRSRDHLGAQVRLIGAEYNADANRADIHFNVEAGPPVTVRVTGAHLWSWTQRKLLPVYDQTGLTPELIQEGRQNLISHFRSEGYFDVQVESELQQQSSSELVLYRITKGQRRKIVGVAFTGNTHFDKDELEKHISVEKAGFLTHGKYDAKSVKTLAAFYQSAGFNQVKVASQFKMRDGDMVVEFTVDEGPQDLVESLQIEGNTQPIERLAPDGLRIAANQPYGRKSIDDDRNKIMTHYLEQGYLSATFEEAAEPLPGDPHRFQVTYKIKEGAQLHAGEIVTVGRSHTLQQLIDRDIRALQPGEPLAERELLKSESRLYNRGIFDWAEVDARRRTTDEGREDVIVKVHEARRNAITYGLGFESINRGGSVPAGTVALPDLPPVGLPANFTTSQRTFIGPRASIQYTRSNFLGKAATISVGALGGRLIRRASLAYTDPLFHWTQWTSDLAVSGESNMENPIFNSRRGLFSWQIRKPLDENRTKNLLFRYSFSETALSNLLIPELVPPQDLHTRLSTLSGNFVRDTRDSILDSHKGGNQSIQLDFNSSAFGSNVDFVRLLLQTSHYKDVHSGVIWANSLRLGFEQPFGGSHVPLSEKFFTGGGSSLRGFPLNGAGPQQSVAACGNPAVPSTCSLISVPTGGAQLLIINSELRIPLPIKKGLSFVTFYDGGNVFNRIGFHEFGQNYTNSVGIGARYATPVGPIRVDVGHNLNGLPGVKSTQIFVTLGQAF